MAVFKKEGYWWIDFYDEDGERKRKKIGRSKKVAQDTLEEVKTQVRQKKLGISADFADAADWSTGTSFGPWFSALQAPDWWGACKRGPV